MDKGAIKIKLLVFFLAFQLFSQDTKSCLLKGKVTDLFGNSLSGAIIQIKDENSKKMMWITDSEGNYSIYGFPCDKINLKIGAPNFVTEQFEIDFAKENVKELNLGLAIGGIADVPAVKVRGKVVDENNNKIKSANVRLIAELNERVGNSAITSSNGKFEIVILNPAKYTLEVIAENKKSYRTQIMVDVLGGQIIKVGKIKLDKQ